MKEFLEYAARSLVDEPDRVTVDVQERDEEVELTLTVEERDMGKVIGRDGRIAKALRNLLRVMATRDGRHVELEIRSHDE
ncbi:MAG: KH domain-containing protein [Chloroflexota bacterium]|nr:KH domain-containing protein [Chloroflexota bacterium]